MCYTVTAAGLELLHAHDRMTKLVTEDLDGLSGPPSPAAPVGGERLLAQARHDVHVAGWTLALEHALDGAPLALRGARESVLSPPLRPGTGGACGDRAGRFEPAWRAHAARIPAYRPDGRAGCGGAF